MKVGLPRRLSHFYCPCTCRLACDAPTVIHAHKNKMIVGLPLTQITPLPLLDCHLAKRLPSPCLLRYTITQSLRIKRKWNESGAISQITPLSLLDCHLAKRLPSPCFLDSPSPMCIKRKWNESGAISQITPLSLLDCHLAKRLPSPYFLRYTITHAHKTKLKWKWGYHWHR